MFLLAVLSITGMANLFQFAGHIQSFQTFHTQTQDQCLKKIG